MNNMQTLRDHLFDTLKGLKDGSLEVEKAKVIGDISQVLINTAKVEVDFIRANSGGKSEFFASEVKQISETSNGTVTRIGNVTEHKLRG